VGAMTKREKEAVVALQDAIDAVVGEGPSHWPGKAMMDLTSTMARFSRLRQALSDADDAAHAAERALTEEP